jgi:hypothetical protein
MGEVRALGFDGFLGKPLDPGRFADQLDRLLARQSVWEISWLLGPNARFGESLSLCQTLPRDFVSINSI